MTISRRSLVIGSWGAGTLNAMVARGATAQELRSSRILVGVPAGAPGDLLARAVADKMRGRYASTFVVENLPGASTQLAISAAVRSTPDGSTLLLTPSSPLSLFPSTFAKLPYRPDADLKPLTLAAMFNHAFAIGPSVPQEINSLGAYLEWAKANPDKATYGTSGVGTIPHLLCVMLGRLSAAPMLNVPYKGSSLAVTELLGGQIAAMSSPIGTFLAHMPSGKVRLLAVSGSERSRLAPTVPTYQELGFPIVAREWLGFFAPQQVSTPLAQAAAKGLCDALDSPELARRAATHGLEVVSSSPEALAGMLHADSHEWRRVIRETGFKAEL
ncbi:twin-arginine translocation pathway signal protein [Comamonas thiooxydans]|uniref:Twin-arginine translocation pathway signal protein n=1 Tax=Comamonas thiooxydans TaxID=363952 RepID=A0A0E3BXU2_9BURK|nr:MULTISPECIES: tripartite tricarboxylate transporter substrate-binding protein [Comamonas]KGH11873.1 twin-arginine translocation pathway signal protein [Comamonas thiooxydans]KGH19044.1 twin-arginine translocation pathway signal protein [Comamonas thiooxydans]